MNKEYCIELIHSEIDGIITQEEKKQLHQYLALNPEMNQLYSQLVNSQNVLNQAVDIDSPPEMKGVILNSIDQNKYASPKDNILIHFLKNIMMNARPAPKYVYSFSIGIILGAFAIVVLYHGIDNFTNNKSKLSGAIISSGFSEDFEIINDQDINILEVSGNIKISRNSENIRLDLLLTSEKEIEIVSEFNSGDLGFLSFIQHQDRTEKLNSGVGSLRFIHQGSNSYNILFKNKAVNQSQIVFSIFSGELIYRRKIILESL